MGVTAALELRRRGAAVCIVDRGPLPQAVASSNDISKMLRLDYGSDDFYMAMMEAAFPLWREWNARWGEELYHEVGFLVMLREQMRPGGYEYESYRQLRERGHRPQRLDAAALAARYPAWAADTYVDGYHNAFGGWAESGRILARLSEEARAAGVELCLGASVARLCLDEGRLRGVLLTDGQRLTAEVTIIAAGAWTPTLLPHLKEAMWAVGQPVLHFRPSPAVAADFAHPRFTGFAADISRTGWYGFPLHAGVVKIANHGPGLRLDPRAPREVLPGEEERFREFLRATFPTLAEAPCTLRRLCLYCDTWDGHFWIDHDRELPGLLVATGGCGHAFKFAPLLGGLIADVLEGKENPYAARFAWRERGAVLAREEARNTGSA